ncbi:MAG: hypothetical protein ACYCX2_12110 [Christensenellales bacterium]
MTARAGASPGICGETLRFCEGSCAGGPGSDEEQGCKQCRQLINNCLHCCFMD